MLCPMVKSRLPDWMYGLMAARPSLTDALLRFYRGYSPDAEEVADADYEVIDDNEK